MQLWLGDEDDRTSFWMSQGGQSAPSESSSAGQKRSADLQSWMMEAQTRSKRQNRLDTDIAK